MVLAVVAFKPFIHSLLPVELVLLVGKHIFDDGVEAHDGSCSPDAEQLVEGQPIWKVHGVFLE